MPTLETTILGRTGLTVTRLGAGGHFTNGPTAHEDIPRRVRELHHMIDGGISYHDVQWDPEELAMAEVLKTRAGEITVAWPLHGVSGRAPEGLARYIVDYCADHRRRYGIEHVDILLWVALELKPETEEAVMAEVRDGFARVKAQGFCDHAAFSCHHSPAMALQAIRGFAEDFDVMMVPYGPLNPAAGEELLPLAQSRGVGTVAMKPFVGGDGLFNQAWAGKVEGPELDCWQGSGRPYQAALRWVMRDPHVDTVAPGMHSVQEIDDLLAAAQAALGAEDEALLAAYQRVQDGRGRQSTWGFLHPWLA